MRASAHVHTRYGDGKDSPEAMILRAMEKGFTALGFSEHGHLDFDPENCMSREAERAYRREIAFLKDKYAGQIQIRLGVERDEFGLSEREHYEYVIGSKHYFRRGDDFFAVDNNPQTMRAGIDRFFGGEGLKLAVAYYEAFAAYVASYKPDIIAHFDLLTKFNDGGRFFDEDDSAYLAAGYAALEAMRPTDALLEVNTGAIARGYKKTPYPDVRFLRRWRELGGRAIIGSDCHDAQKLDCAYDLAASLLKDAGFAEAFALGAGEALFTPYAL